MSYQLQKGQFLTKDYLLNHFKAPQDTILENLASIGRTLRVSTEIEGKQVDYDLQTVHFRKAYPIGTWDVYAAYCPELKVIYLSNWLDVEESPF